MQINLLKKNDANHLITTKLTKNQKKFIQYNE